jgi:hypothetical protein
MVYPIRVILIGYSVPLQRRVFLSRNKLDSFGGHSMYIGTVPMNDATDGKRRTGNEGRGVSQPNGVIHVLTAALRVSISGFNSNQNKEGCSPVSPSCSTVALGSCSVRHRNRALLRAPLSFSPAGYNYAGHGNSHGVGN